MTALAHVLRVKFDKTDKASMTRSAALREAQDLLEGSCAGQVRLLGPTHPDTLETLDALGLVLLDKGEFAGAEASLRQASQGRSHVLGPAHPDTLRSLKHLAYALDALGRTDEAVRLSLEVAEGHRQTFGPGHIQTSSAFGYAVESLRRTKNSVAMRELCERWLREILASPVDPDPYQRSQRALRLGTLAYTLFFRLPAPVPFDVELAVRAATTAAEQGNDTHDNNWTRLSLVHLRLGQVERAEWALRESMKRRNGDDCFDAVTQALIHARRGELAEARAWFERASRASGRNNGQPGIGYEEVRDEVAALLGENDVPAGVFALP
jgi:tetratricopeptide (TPR) repeat protein